MIQTPASLNAVTSLLNISILGLVSIETDQNVQTQEASAGATPNYLTDEAPYTYYGTSVWHGYVYQPGNVLIRTDATHAAFNAGAGVIVADIDTGVDPTHPVLKNVLVSGYDFTRNSNGGSEMADVSQSSVAVLDNKAIDLQKSVSPRSLFWINLRSRFWTVPATKLSVTAP